MGFFETFVALRLLRGVKHQKGLLSLSTFISIAGVTVGVMALIIVIGVMTGFTNDLKRKILSVNAHVLVMKAGGAFTSYQKEEAGIKAIPGVVTVAPFIYTQVMFSAPGNVSAGVVRGLDLESIRRGGPPALKVEQGQFADLAEGGREDPPRIALGTEMARNLNLAVGDYLNIISPLGTLTPMGRLPRMKAFRVTAIFHTGMYEFDNSLVYTSIPALQEFLGLGSRITGLEVGGAANEISVAGVRLGHLWYGRQDFPAYSKAALGLAITAVGSSLYPALRAAHYRPTEALRKA